MGTLTIKSSYLSRQAEYIDTENGLYISLNYQVNETSKELENIDGNLYKGEGREYAGRFSGKRDGEEIVYSTSGVKLADMPKLYDAITDIENQIAEEFED